MYCGALGKIGFHLHWFHRNLRIDIHFFMTDITSARVERKDDGTYVISGKIKSFADCIFSALDGKYMIEKLTAVGVGLQTLKGVPVTITELNVEGNELRSLDGLESCPALERLNVARNQLMDLKGCPPTVKSLRCSYNPLVSLQGISPKVLHLGCSYTHLTSLKHLPPTVTDMIAVNCLISSLVDVQPEHCKMTRLYLSGNLLRSAQGVPAAKVLDLSANLLDDLKGVPDEHVSELIVNNNHLTGWSDVPTCVEILRIGANRISGVHLVPSTLKLLEASKNSGLILENPHHVECIVEHC